MTIISFSEISQTTIANRGMGEGMSTGDLDQDGSPELYIYIATKRQPDAPSYNDVAIIEIDDNLALDPKYVNQIDPALNTTPQLDHLSDRFPINGGPFQTSWLQDEEFVDFNGDGRKDLFVGDHGAEWPADGYDSYEPEDWGELFANDPGFQDAWPGGHIQVLLSGTPPELVQVTDTPRFYHQSAVGDIDGDGDADIVTTDFRQVRTYLNDGNGNFDEGAPVAGSGAASSSLRFSTSNVEAADFDGNGVAEVLIASTAGAYMSKEPGLRLAEYDAETDRYDVSVIDYPDITGEKTGGNPVDEDYVISDKISIGDYDADGDLDALIKLIDDKGDGVTAFTYIYRNDGDGEFTVVDYEAADHTNGGFDADFIDLNDDGLLDIFYGGWQPNLSYEDVVDYIYLNQGNDDFVRLSDLSDSPELETNVSEPHATNPQGFLVNFSIEEIDGKSFPILLRDGEWQGEDEVLLASLRIFDGRKTGTASNDVVATETGNYIYELGEGDDVVNAGGGQDRYIGGEGFDTLRLPGRGEDFNITDRDIWLVEDGQRFKVDGIALRTAGNDQTVKEAFQFERVEFNDQIVALEVSGNEAEIFRLYSAAFDRSPDPNGLGFWLHQSDNGASLEDMAVRFIRSVEFTTSYGEDFNATTFVEMLYENVLDRQPDSDGLEWWSNQINQGEFSRESALVRFANSSENIEKVEPLMSGGVVYEPWGLE